MGYHIRFTGDFCCPVVFLNININYRYLRFFSFNKPSYLVCRVHNSWLHYRPIVRFRVHKLGLHILTNPHFSFLGWASPLYFSNPLFASVVSLPATIWAFFCHFFLIPTFRIFVFNFSKILKKIFEPNLEPGKFFNIYFFVEFVEFFQNKYFFVDFDFNKSTNKYLFWSPG